MKYRIKNVKLVFPEGEDAVKSAKEMLEGFKALDNPEKEGLFVPYEIAMQLTVMPQPDSLTDLVPCGCGEAPRIVGTDGTWRTTPFIGCPSCGVKTSFSQRLDQTINAWNRAMGYAVKTL